jgi:hypothetical protein
MVHVMTDQEKEQAEKAGKNQEQQSAKEPTYYRKSLERDEWSGRDWGGHGWNGRSR